MCGSDKSVSSVVILLSFLASVPQCTRKLSECTACMSNQTTLQRSTNHCRNNKALGQF